MTDLACAVVGGGIAGASVAYHLAERGVEDVTVFESGELASRTTAKSFAMFGTYGNRTQFELKQYSMRLYNRLARETDDLTYERIGHLSVATTTHVAENFQRAIAGEPVDAGIFATGGDRTSVSYLPGEEIEDRLFVPALDTADVKGAVYRPEVGYFDPVDVTTAMTSRARDAGVEFRENTPVTDLVVDDERVAGVRVDGATVTADSVVLTAGPWTPGLAASVGVDLPVRHTIAPVLVLDPGDRSQTLPSVKHHETDVNVRGNAGDGTVYVGSHRGKHGQGERLDADEVPSSVPAEVRSEMFASIERLLPDLADAPVVDEWVGVRSLTPDGDPIVDETAIEGLFVVGFNTSGIQLSPGIGRVVASQVTGETPTEWGEELSLRRFEGDEPR
jgi:sarcosine oxidase subunit beta